MAPKPEKPKKKQSYLKRKRKEMGKRYGNKKYARLKKSVGTDAMGQRVQKLLANFDLYKSKFHNRLDEKRQQNKQNKQNKQAGGKKTKRKNKKKRRRTRKR
tara:strand:+ start:10542 stop:10844 length:303 start_codon:yes stop_codon:yes gene_type:complete